MPRPLRSLTDAAGFPGTITSTPNRILKRLAIRKLIVRGVKRGGSR